MVIAIDGPSGVGKSTVARAVADALGIPYLDTGAYYRLATLVALRHGVADHPPGILAALDEVVVDFADGQLLLDGDDVSSQLRSPEVTASVSRVAADPAVRTAVVDMQRRWVADHGGRAVVEGRDIGTVVFPEAPVKVFLTADAETRARRRSGDTEAAGKTLQTLITEMAARDAADSSRQVSPLRPDDDALTIDTSSMTVAEVVGRILDAVGTI